MPTMYTIFYMPVFQPFSMYTICALCRLRRLPSADTPLLTKPTTPQNPPRLQTVYIAANARPACFLDDADNVHNFLYACISTVFDVHSLRPVLFLFRPPADRLRTPAPMQPPPFDYQQVKIFLTACISAACSRPTAAPVRLRTCRPVAVVFFSGGWVGYKD